MIGIPISTFLGGLMTPIGSSINLLCFNQLQAATGLNFTFIQWMTIGAPFGIIMLPIAWWILCKVYKPVEIGRDMLSAALGFGQGLQAVVGYNYGARRYDRVKSSFRFIITVSVIIIAILSCLCIIFAPDIIGAFRRDDPQVIGIGATAMRIQASALIFQSMIVSTIMLLQSTGKAKEATVLSCCRQGIFFFPCIILLPRLFGLPGVQIAQSVSDLFTAAAAVPFCIGFFRKLNAADDRQIPE